MDKNTEEQKEQCINIGGSDEEAFFKLYNEDVNDKSLGWSRKSASEDVKDGFTMQYYSRPNGEG